ncbi:zonular occludens toxin domain-containing protein [Duganella sp. PWIR1]
MIELITGLPGNGKTLYTISTVKKIAESENRAVYYAGIPELTLDWIPIDPTKWMEAPPNSIIVIDEAQKIFRNRSLGTQPGKHVTDLETHRHLGIDLFLLTQHPSLIDPAIRRLAGRHRHMVRVWGMAVSTVHKWDAVKDNPDKSRTDSEKTKWAFDKSVYQYYKSADVHTMKRTIPGRVKLLAGCVVVLIGVGFYMKNRIEERTHPDQLLASGASPSSSVGKTDAVDRAPVPDKFDPKQDMQRYVQMSTPRIEGLPQTAPKYDELTKPTRVPVPAACIQVADKCRCFSQQGTSLDVKYSMCIEFARNGFFQEFDPERDRRDSVRTAESVRVLEGRGVEQVASHGGERQSSQVAVFGNPPQDAPRKPSVGM